MRADTPEPILAPNERDLMVWANKLSSRVVLTRVSAYNEPRKVLSPHTHIMQRECEPTPTPTRENLRERDIRFFYVPYFENHFSQDMTNS